MQRALAIVLVLAAGFLSGCVSEPTDEQRSDIRHHGVHLSPRAYEGADFTSFFKEVGAVGDTLAWSGDWIHLPRRDTTPDIVGQRADAEGYRNVFLATFFDPDTGQPVRPVNDSTKRFYVEGAGLFAAAHEPDYMGLGIDVDMLWAGNRSVYEDFVTWYPDARAAIRSASPTTKVFPVFHYEHVKGLRGGISNGTAGGGNETRSDGPTLWHLLDDFPERDLTAFSSYPGLYYRNPGDIPDDHYDDIGEHVDGPVAITETAWHAAPWPEGWESSVDEQGAYVERFFDIAPPLEFMLWRHLYDQPGVEPFDAMGLIDHDRTPRPAWHELRAEAHPETVDQADRQD